MDLIDRQAAIEHLRNNIAYMRAFGCDRAITLIREVPSVQPEKRTDKHTETHACDLIRRQAAIDEIRRCRFVVDAIEKINGLPSAQPERKKGRWIFIRPTKEDRLYVACDQCGQVEAWDENCGMLCALLGEKYAHYCPNCGAYMGD